MLKPQAVIKAVSGAEALPAALFLCLYYTLK